MVETIRKSHNQLVLSKMGEELSSSKIFPVLFLLYTVFVHNVYRHVVAARSINVHLGVDCVLRNHNE